MFVHMSVRNRFAIEIYGFMHNLRTFWHMPLRMPLRDGMEIEVDGRRLTAQQKDEKRQDIDDKKRLVRHLPSNLLRSLTVERIGGGQHGIFSTALRALPFRTFHVLRVRHLIRICVLIVCVRNNDDGYQ